MIVFDIVLLMNQIIEWCDSTFQTCYELSNTAIRYIIRISFEPIHRIPEKKNSIINRHLASI